VSAIQLPEKPEGFTRRMNMHMSFGDGGVGSYTVFMPNGEPAPFGYQYDTRPGGKTGFTVNGEKDPMTWAQLRLHFAALEGGAA